MASIEDKIREIRTAISQVQNQKARAAVELDNAKSRLKEAREALKTEYGVVTADDAKAKLTELQSELNDIVSEVEKALEEAGATG